MFLLHVLLFEGFKTSKLPIFKLETLTFPLSPRAPLSAELHCKLNLQASQLFQTLWSTEVETCEESGWLTLHSPSIHSHYPCSLLPAEGEERDTGDLAVWTRLLRSISDSEKEDPLTYGVMSPELKPEDSAVWDGSCRAELEGSAVRAGLLDGGHVQSVHMMWIRDFSQNTAAILKHIWCPANQFLPLSL